MAQQVIVQFVDDLDGSVASGTVNFALDGKDYDIDLSDENAAKLRDALALFVGAARRSGGRRRPAQGGQRPTANRERIAAVRAWARENGHKVAERGRIPAAVLEAYEQRNAAPPAPAEVEKPKRSRRAPKVATDPFATTAG
ncbi:MAG: hypothetical protein QOI10_3959 [Solirubrobacterales bacterium]|nr:hypothetical protein [Solirubrobacterales bacterium]